MTAQSPLPPVAVGHVDPFLPRPAVGQRLLPSRRRSVLRALPLAAVTVAAFVVSGCAQTVAGTAAPEPRDEPVAASLPHSGAPAVTTPLSVAELRRIERHPCVALTPAQARTLGVPVDKAFAGLSGPSCKWDEGPLPPIELDPEAYLEDRASVSMIFPIDIVYQGLSQLYETHHRDRVEDYFFAMPPIDGLPVLASTAADMRDEGNCRIQIGLTNRKVVYLSVSLSEPNIGVLEPCGKARDVGVLAVRTMRRLR